MAKSKTRPFDLIARLGNEDAATQVEILTERGAKAMARGLNHRGLGSTDPVVGATIRLGYIATFNFTRSPVLKGLRVQYLHPEEWIKTATPAT